MSWQFASCSLPRSGPSGSFLSREATAVPYRSEKQRRFMHAKHPKIAARWDAKYGGKIKKKRKRRHKGASESST